MKSFCLYTIIGIDAKQKRTFVLSDDETKISLPILPIENPRYLYNEIKYNTRYLLGLDKDIDRSLSVSYIDIQNSLVLEYIDSLNNSDYSHDDIFINVGIMLNQTYQGKLFWNEFFFGLQMLESDPVIYHMIDNTIKRSII